MKICKAKSVYAIMNPENNRIKIGIAYNVKTRLISLESGAGCKLEIINNTHPILFAEQAERDTHKLFKDKRYFGEWFNITREEANDCINNIKLKYALDDMVRAYLKQNMSIVDIAEKYGVTRQAVVKRLKQYGIYGVVYPEEINITKKDKGIDIDITKYDRIAPNTYKHKITQEVIMAEWNNGKMQTI